MRNLTLAALAVLATLGTFVALRESVSPSAAYAQSATPCRNVTNTATSGQFFKAAQTGAAPPCTWVNGTAGATGSTGAAGATGVIAGAITPNGPNVLYEYEVTGVSLLATGATTVFTTAPSFGRFRITNWAIEVTSTTGSTSAGTLTASVGIAANSYLDGGQISLSASSGRMCWSQATGTPVGCYVSAVPGYAQTTPSGGASIAANTAVAFNITSALTTATTSVVTVRVWGFYQ